MVISMFHFSFYRFFPFGVNGMLAGSAVVFFSYIGFDAVTSAAEEVLLVNSDSQGLCNVFITSKRLRQETAKEEQI